MTGQSERTSVFAALGMPSRVGEDGGSVAAKSRESVKRSDYWNPTLNIRFVDGSCTTFLYSHLQWMNFQPSKGIILHFSTHTVKVSGRNLHGLYDDLLELRCRHITVVNAEHDLGELDAQVVHRVDITQIGSERPPSH